MEQAVVGRLVYGGLSGIRKEVHVACFEVLRESRKAFVRIEEG
jgi:hypothetical protein